MKMGLVFLLSVFLVSYLLGSLLENNRQTESFFNKSTCDLLNGSCHIVNRDIEYEIAFDGVPSPLTPFGIRLTALDSKISHVGIEFEMEEMDMGNNFYSLENKGKFWDAQVLLPVCSLGRNDWLLRVNVVRDEVMYSTELKFSQ